MAKLWSFLRDKGNREVLAWIGGGIVVVASGAWAVFIFFWTPSSSPPPGSGPQTNVEASDGGVAIGGDVSGSTIETGAPPAAE